MRLEPRGKEETTGARAGVPALAPVREPGQVVREIVEQLRAGQLPEAVQSYERCSGDIGFRVLAAVAGDDRLERAATELFAGARDYPMAARVLAGTGDLDQAAAMYERGGDAGRAAELYLQAGLPARAAPMFERSGALDRAARTYLMLGEQERAAICFERAGDPFNAAQLFHELGQLGRALELFERVAPSEPSWAEARLTSAELLADQGRPAVALETFRAVAPVLTVTTDVAESCYALAGTLERRGARAEAREVLQQLAVWRPEYADVRDRLAALAGDASPLPVPPTPDAIAQAPVPWMEGFEFLKRNPLFEGLSLQELRIVYDAAERRRFGRREVLIEQDVPGDTLFVLLKGWARVVKQRGKKEKLVARLGAGAPVGEMSLIDEAPTSARVVAETEVEALCITRQRLEALFATHDAIALKLYRSFVRTLARRLRSTSDNLARAPTPRVPVAKLSLWELLRLDGPAMLGRLRALTAGHTLVELRAGPRRIHVVNSPELAAQVLQGNHVNYRKSDNYVEVAHALGQGLLTSEGEHWKRQRRLAQPAFHREQISRMIASMVTAIGKTLDRWEPAARRGDTIELSDEMIRLTLSAVGLALFNSDLDGEATRLGDGVAAALAGINRRILAPVKVPLGVPTPANLQLRRAIHRLHQHALAMVSERRRQPEAGMDLLGMLISARDAETGEGMTDLQLRDEVLTLLAAGHETTAAALCWSLSLLIDHPEIEARLRAEATAQLGDRTPVAADVPRLGLAQRVFQEALRLYPPLWLIERQAKAPDTLGEYGIPAGALVGISAYLLHHHPEHWEKPDTFDPDRFLPERSQGRHRFAFLPFAAGPRQCIGDQFALTEGTLALAMIVRRFRVRLAPGHQMAPQLLVTLRSRGGMPCVLTPISG